MNDEMTFAQRMKCMREMMGMDQRELALSSNIEPSQIAHYESGSREPNLQNLIKIVRSLRCSADCLLGTWGRRA